MLSHARHSSFELASPLRTGHIPGGWVGSQKKRRSLDARRQPQCASRRLVACGVSHNPGQAIRIPQITFGFASWWLSQASGLWGSHNPRRAVRILRATFCCVPGGFAVSSYCAKFAAHVTCGWRDALSTVNAHATCNGTRAHASWPGQLKMGGGPRSLHPTPRPPRD